MWFQGPTITSPASESRRGGMLVKAALAASAILGCLGSLPPGPYDRQAISWQRESNDDTALPWDRRWFRDVPWAADGNSDFALQLFESIPPGQSFGLRPVRRDDVSQWEFKGACRIADPFPDGRSLWLGLIKVERLAILIRSEHDAVVLRMYPSFHQAWAAYAVETNAPTPRAARPLELLATDNGRYRRSGCGSVALHWSAGQLILSRGNLRLLTVPFPGQPKDVILEGDFRLRDCRRHAFGGIPDDDFVFDVGIGGGVAVEGKPAEVPPGETAPRAAGISAVATKAGKPLDPPGRIAWEKPGDQSAVSLDPLPDGAVRLAAPPGREPAYFATALPPGVLYDAELDVGRATPGTGIFLADQERKPICGLQFDPTPNAGTLWLSFTDARRGSEPKSRDPGREIIPVTQGKVRLRILWGAGTVRWMTSPDGVHWSFCGPLAERIDRKPHMLGVFCTSAHQDRVLELRGIRLAVDEGLPAWPSRDWAALVPPGITAAENMERWWQEVRMAQPLGAEFPEWTAACAWKTLAENPRTWLHPSLLEASWLALMDSNLPYGEKLRSSRTLAGYMNPRDWGVWNRFYERMEEAAVQAVRQGEPNVFEQHSAMVMTAPLWSEWQCSAFSEALFRHELFTRIHHGEEQAAVDLALQPLFWAVPGDDFVSRSMQRLSLGTLARYPRYCPPSLTRDGNSGEPAGSVADGDKEAYVFWRELEAMLREQAWAEAAQRIWNASASKTPPALFPHPDRVDLFLSLSCLLRVLEERHRELREALVNRYQEQSQILLREAQRRGDERLAVSLTEGLPGLTAASQAAEWLGDRRVVLGRFTEAGSWYETAVGNAANDADRQRITLKQTEVLGGMDAGRSTGGAAQQTDCSCADLDGCVAPDGPPLRITPLFEIPADRMVRADYLPEQDFDWPRRQLGTAAAEEWLIVNNQRDVACYRSQDGALLWEQRLGGDAGDRSVLLAKMRPVVRGETVLCRRSTARGVEVAALSLADGQVLWNLLPLDAAVSDPWFVGDDLFVLAADRLGAGQVGVVLVALDPEGGAVLKRYRLFQLRRVWSDDLNFLVSAGAGTFFSQGEGVVFRADYTGRVRWLREQPWIAPNDRSWWQAWPWYMPVANPPLVDDGRLYVHQPGSWTVEALAAETGEPIWSRTDGQLIGILAAWNGRLWLQAEDGLLVLSKGDGRVERFCPLSNVLAVGFVPQTGQVWCVTSREVPGKGDERQWRFLWLDARDGRIVHEMGVPAEGKDWQFFGPVVATSDGILFMTASRVQPAARRCYRMEMPPKESSLLLPKLGESPNPRR